MLITHKIDESILAAIASFREGATVEEIQDEVMRRGINPLKIDTVRRHLPGLLINCGVGKRAEFRGCRTVTVFFVKIAGRVPVAERATECR